ncbi:MAG: DUF445 domain-containing protein [Candidatus Acididesulfobacter guangdongensis]|uniref:DUF445 domain-containing protein n=1 Tax=Acididesulfobacter guangdongensis TaxID=2597225 RepID=A0A519BEP9_ACIG2|nr:MAG: DUF445 domain-containing protein [Candidatus Acididesulfobacter guangdongensis]
MKLAHNNKITNTTINTAIVKNKILKNKIIANLFLLFAFLIFIISYTIHISNFWIFILQRASAAALIGGIADWFAVTALFKYPLGLHIPHTNIIKNNKEKIINSITNTVNDTWLGKNYLAAEINRIDFSDILLKIIQKDKNRNKARLYLRKLIIKFIHFTKSDRFKNFLYENINKALDKTLSDENISNNIIGKLALFIESGDSDYIYNSLINYVNNYIKTYDTDNLSKRITDLYSDEFINTIKFAGARIINENFNDGINNLSDFIISNIEENKSYLKEQIGDLIEKYKSDSAVKSIFLFVAEKTNILDIELLSNEIIAKIIDFIKEIKNNENNEVRLKIKDYIFNTLNNIDKTSQDKILNTIEMMLNANADKIKDYLINYLNKDEQKEIIKNKLSNFINAEGLNVINRFKDPLKNRLRAIIINFIGAISEYNKKYIVNKKLFKEKFDYFFILIQDEILKNHDKVNIFLKTNVVYLMKINHSTIGKLIKRNLESLDGDKLVNQIEYKIGNDLQYIRINGALVGSVIGTIIALIALLLQKM